MTSERLDQPIDDLLQAIELRELRSLQWGFVDGTLTEADVDALAEEIVERSEASIDPADLVEELVSRRLIFEIGTTDDTPRFRSRYAESVRLLVQLRQLFPGKPWASAPRLVSDYRVDASPRRFPRRDIEPQQVLSDLGQTPSWSELSDRLAHSLLVDAQSPIRLSGFQLRVASNILAKGSGPQALIVTAGTGSGKTLAFYLPALLETIPAIDAERWWTKCVAVYPRIELLKDQFSEAFRLFRVADSVLKGVQRPVILGALFSLTPYRASLDDDVIRSKWVRMGSHFICPFLRCPICGSDMVWRREDLEQGVERLECSQAPRCEGRASDQEVILTRARLLRQPPDFVFTTIETLNQRLSDRNYRRCFGIARSGNEQLKLILLDEVHTYAGTQGAHAAYVLRRWRHASGASAMIVGLSATLREAPRFFAELTGIDESRIKEESARADEYEERGMAYQLLLRGDPASRTSLLSSSIQAAFLLPRLLDPGQGPDVESGPSDGRFGRRIFVFTDDLDITNRLFDDLRDAEAYDHFGRPDPSRAPLAALRAGAAPDHLARGYAGQRWDASESLGHDLARRLGITRTTSQDAGVAAGSEVVVATSALEVGFNDPLVGGIIQHKAPRTLAAYLQRRGRAGRTVEMRPWMVTVLSDYGRDRLSFQAYERLLDPLLPAQRLPIQNRYVMRMQAVFAFIDWIAAISPARESRSWWWWALNGPAKTDRVQRQQHWLIELLGELLDGQPRRLQSLRDHLRHALNINDSQVDELLWAAPRSLLLEAIPTLARRLQAGWVAHPFDVDHYDLLDPNGPPHPLPDFLPANLFSDLNLPEVTIAIPPATPHVNQRREPLPIVQALRLLVPGRVTRRFAHERGGLNHWLPVPLDANEVALSIDDYAQDSEFVATVPSADGNAALVPCYRPWSIRLHQAPRNVYATSNATFSWSSRLITTSEPVSLPMGSSTPWRQLFRSVDFYLHSRRASVTVQRYTQEAIARVRLLGRDDDHVVRVGVTDSQGDPAAIGFEQQVDGLHVELELPTAEELVEMALGRPDLAGWRAGYFRDRVRSDPTLAVSTNRFQREWLHQIYLAALLAHGEESDSHGLEEAAAGLRAKGVAETTHVLMEHLFRFEAANEGPDSWDGEEIDETQDRGESPRLVQSLAALFADSSIVAQLENIASLLWDAKSPEGFGIWLRERLADTIGEAIALGCQHLAPAHSSTDVLVLDVVQSDHDRRDQPRGFEVWITESVLGGAGVLDAIARAYAADPSSFGRALEAAIAPTDLEVVTTGLDLTLAFLVSDPACAEAADAVRARDDHSGREAARAALYHLLGERGIGVDHSLSVALNQRLLRRGASSNSDRLLADLQDYWTTLQARYGLSIDLRTLAYLASVSPNFGDRLRNMVSAVVGHSPSIPEVVGILSGILWPKQEEIRGRALESSSPFRESGRADPGLARAVLEAAEPVIDFESSSWQESVAQALGEGGSAIVRAGGEAERELHAAIYRLVAMPVDYGYLQFYPSVDGIQRNDGALSVRFVVRELA